MSAEPDADGVWRSKDCAGVAVSFDEDEPTVWRMTLKGPAGTPYADGLIRLVVKFPKEYPFKQPSVVHDGMVPFHPNIIRGQIGCCCGPFFCCGKSEWAPTHMVARDLPISYMNLLAQPHLEGAVNHEAAILYQQSCEPGGQYWWRALASIGRTPAWSRSAHASFPRGVRARVSATLVAVRLFERRLVRTMNVGAGDMLVWPHAQAVPCEVIENILALVAHDGAEAYGPPDYDEEVDASCEEAAEHEELA